MSSSKYGRIQIHQIKITYETSHWGLGKSGYQCAHVIELLNGFNYRVGFLLCYAWQGQRDFLNHNLSPRGGWGDNGELLVQVDLRNSTLSFKLIAEFACSILHKHMHTLFTSRNGLLTSTAFKYHSQTAHCTSKMSQLCPLAFPGTGRCLAPSLISLPVVTATEEMSPDVEWTLEFQSVLREPEFEVL